MKFMLTASSVFQSFVDAPAWAMLLLKITAILAAAWLLHVALNRANPRWRVFLWRVTAVGLIALPAAWLFPAWEIRVQQPPVVEEAAKNIPISSLVPAVERDATAAAQNSLLSNMSDKTVPQQLSPQPKKAEPSPSSQPQSSAPAILKPSIITMPMLLLSVWLGGIVVLICRLCIGHYRIWRLAYRAKQPPQWVQEECLRVARAIDCRGCVKVVQSTTIKSPLLCGFRRPLLLMPTKMCENSYRNDLPGILAHELTHLRSHDIPWNVGLHLISIVLWFHPLAWHMRKAHLLACEQVSDAVSAGFVGDVAGYCRTLARVAVHAYSTAPTTGIAMARLSTISRRLNALKKKISYMPLRRRSVVGFGFITLLVVAVLGVLQFALAAPPSAEPSVAVDNTETKSVEKEAKPVKDADSTPKAGSLRVLVLDPQGKPLPDANIHASIWTEEKDFKANHDYNTDAAGAVQVELPKTYSIVRLWASKKSFVTMFSHWEENELASGTKLPSEYTIQLESSVTAGGRFVDEESKPIAGAKVKVMLEGGKPAKSDGRSGYDTGLATGNEAATTDADGRWRIGNVPNNAQAKLRLMVFHPDYISDEYGGELQKDADITTEMLLSETAKMTLKRGIIVQGRVTDADGKPIKDALVVRGEDPYIMSTGNGVPSVFPTDIDGRFRMTAMPPGERVLTVIAPGWAPQLRRVNLQSGMASQDFRMAPGKQIQLRFVDDAGKPIPGVYVMIEGWRGGKSIYNIKHPNIPESKIPEKADQNGVWDWTWAPDDPVKLHCYSYPLKGFTPCELEIAGGAPPRTITLKSEHRITGRVTDSATGKPIPSFTIIPIDVFRTDWLSAERFNAKAGNDGRLDYLAERTDIPLRLRVEAKGYRTQTGPEFRVGDDAPRIQDFRLQPSGPVMGVVLDAAGKPVEKAEVLLATPTEQAGLGGQNDDLLGNQTTLTDATGRFAFPNPGEMFTIVVQTDAGFAMADFPVNQLDAGTHRLQPWASVRGRFRDGGQPVKGATFFMQLLRPYTLDKPRIDTNRYQINTDASGRFEFPRVPPVPVSICVDLGPWRDEGFLSGPSVPLALKPGQQVDLDLGNTGAIIKGKVKLTGKVPADLDCTYSINYLVSRSSGVTPPPSIANLGFDIRKGWQSAWLKTQEGQTYLNTLQHWFVKLAPDGAFRISGVPPGEYDLAIEIYAKPSGCLVDPLAQKTVYVKVTDADAARGEVTLPEISATVVPVPAIGDTPALSFQRADGSDGSLADFRGRFTIVHFWASWCGPCKQQIPALKQLQEKFASHGPAMLSLSLNDDTAVWQAALKQLDLPWQQGKLDAAAAPGVSSVPAYWLLDPTGKIVAKVNDPDELATAADKAETKPAGNKVEIPDDARKSE